MPDFMQDDDALLRSMGRIPVIRALLARIWPHLSKLSPLDRDLALDAMALREYRCEQLNRPVQ